MAVSVAIGLGLGLLSSLARLRWHLIAQERVRRTPVDEPVEIEMSWRQVRMRTGASTAVDEAERTGPED
jgi:hypothetical protein